MHLEGIAKVFGEWVKKESYEWLYEKDCKTYKMQSYGLFKQSMPEVSTQVKYPLYNEEVFVISDYT